MNRAGLLTLQILACITVVQDQANAGFTIFSISQQGWSGGGEIFGTFSGMDQNGDGFIKLIDGELSSYEIEFTGNALIPTFSHDFGDLQFFEFELGSGGFPPSFPLFSDNGAFFYDADDGTIGTSPPVGGGLTIGTLEPALVGVVPEPASFALFGIGAIGLTAVRRRRQKEPLLSS